MSGDQMVDRMILRSEILGDIAASLRSAAVVYRHSGPDMETSRMLSTLADKMDLRGRALQEDAEEMSR